MIPICGLYMNRHMRPATMGARSMGIKSRVRKILLPLKSRLNRMARAIPTMNSVLTAEAVKMKLVFREAQKRRSCTTLA